MTTSLSSTRGYQPSTSSILITQHGTPPATPPIRSAPPACRRFGVELDPDTELMGLLGSKEGIFKLPMVFVNPGDVVLVPDPGYITYTAGARFAGGEVVHMPLTAENLYLPDLKALPADVLGR